MATKHRSKEEWAQLIAGFDSSQQTVTQYCKRHGVSVSGFYLWKNRLQSTNNEPEDCGQDDWFPLSTSPDNSPQWDMELELPNGVVLRMKHASC